MVAVEAGTGVQVGTAVGWTANASAAAAFTVAWMSGVGADVGVGSAAQAAKSATKANNTRLFPMRGAYAREPKTSQRWGVAGVDLGEQRHNLIDSRWT